MEKRFGPPRQNCYCCWDFIETFGSQIALRSSFFEYTHTIMPPGGIHFAIGIAISSLWPAQYRPLIVFSSGIPDCDIIIRFRSVLLSFALAFFHFPSYVRVAARFYTSSQVCLVFWLQNFRRSPRYQYPEQALSSLAKHSTEPFRIRSWWPL